MLISTRHGFVVLSNTKCASSSLTAALAPHCSMVFGKDYRVRHTPYRDYQTYVLPFLRHRMGDDADQLKVFSLMREPTDWRYSWYRFRSRSEVAPGGVRESKRFSGDMSWTEFLDAHLSDSPPPAAKFGSQKKFLRGADGSLDGLTLYRFEDINAFLDDIAEIVGKPVKAERRNVSPAKDKAEPRAVDYEKCRKMLAREYEIYDAIPVRTR